MWICFLDFVSGLPASGYLFKIWIHRKQRWSVEGKIRRATVKNCNERISLWKFRESFGETVFVSLVCCDPSFLDSVYVLLLLRQNCSSNENHVVRGFISLDSVRISFEYCRTCIVWQVSEAGYRHLFHGWVAFGMKHGMYVQRYVQLETTPTRLLFWLERKQNGLRQKNSLAATSRLDSKRSDVWLDYTIKSALSIKKSRLY